MSYTCTTFVHRRRGSILMKRDYRAGASVDIVEKDMQLVLALAKDLQADVPMVDSAKRVYERGKEHGLGELDIAAVEDLSRHR